MLFNKSLYQQDNLDFDFPVRREGYSFVMRFVIDYEFFLKDYQSELIKFINGKSEPVEMVCNPGEKGIEIGKFVPILFVFFK